MIRRWLLKRSIKKHGVLVPVLVTEDGIILDGTNRIAIAKEPGITLPVAYVDADIFEVDARELDDD